MLNLNNKRAALLAGLSFAVLSSATSSHANTTNWGAIQAPADIAVPEPARKPKKERAANPKPSAARQSEIKRSQPGEAGTVEVAFAPAFTPMPVRAVADEPKAKKPSASKPDRKDRKSAKPEPAELVIPSGPLHIIVSIDAQRASLYANGALVASTKVSTGTKTHPTPLGVFAVIQKNRHHISNLYGAPMPYMQRLTWSGTALHTGVLPGYPASHGCIRLPDEFAQLLWKATKLGARVIVTRDEVKPLEIAHARLQIPAAPVAQPQAAPAETTGAMVRTADATGSLAMTETAPSAGAIKPIIKDPLIDQPARAKSAAERKQGPVSIFISRKDGRLYVRQALQPLFDVPLKLRDPAQPLGTHVYTAMDMKDGAMRWTSVSVPSAFPREMAAAAISTKGKKKSSRTDLPVVSEPPAPSATEALERIDLPQEVLDRLAGLVIPGSSLIVSDNPLSSETGKYTDFVVLTR